MIILSFQDKNKNLRSSSYGIFLWQRFKALVFKYLIFRTTNIESELVADLEAGLLIRPLIRNFGQGDFISSAFGVLGHDEIVFKESSLSPHSTEILLPDWSCSSLHALVESLVGKLMVTVGSIMDDDCDELHNLNILIGWLDWGLVEVNFVWSEER